MFITITITITNDIQTVTNWTKLPNGETVAEEDLKQGKIIVRTQKEGTTTYKNIRNTLEKLELPQLLQYKIGIGTAFTRTAQQKELARRYTDAIIKNATDNMILVDGSINTKDNPKSIKKQRLEQSSYGGYGGIWVNKRTNQIKGYFKNIINTNDAQKAEIQGIKAALEIINETNVKDFTILCDCKNAVKYSNKFTKIPKKYAGQLQQIHSQLTQNNKKGSNVNIEWIPGQTGNTWNELADKMAKKATNDWTTPNTSTGLIASFPPFIRALDVTDVRFLASQRGNGMNK